MEKRTFTNILITLGILSLIPICFWIFAYLQNQHIDWDEKYVKSSKEPYTKEPYNSYMLFNLLKSYKTDKEFVLIDNLLTKKLAEEEIKNAKTPMSYIFLGDYPILLDDEIDSLMGFVKKGNTAFFAATNLPDTLFTLLGFETQTYEYSYDSLISTNFLNSSIEKNPPFRFNYRKNNESVGTYWYYFSDFGIEKAEKKKIGTQYSKLGYLNKLTKSEEDISQYDYQENEEDYQDSYSEDEYTHTDEIIENEDVVMKENYLNFIRIKYGKGYFYLHKNPILFTNYYLIQEDGKKYVERALSYLPEGAILWDERSHFAKVDINGKEEYQKQQTRPSPLSYILAQESFAWGYYTLLVSALLFVIFRGKRMQRIIPILRKEENTSLEFTKTIGQLYYLQKDHKRLSQLKIRLFFDFIRTKYHMNTQNIDEDFRKKLSERSDINREFIDLLLADIQKINGQHEVSEWLLRKIHTQIQEFYTNCK